MISLTNERYLVITQMGSLETGEVQWFGVAFLKDTIRKN